MLKNRYQEILIGMGPISLVRGIISLRRNRSTLLIDDKRFSTECYPGVYLSDLEVNSFLRLGNKYEIPELIDLKQFLVPAQIEVMSRGQRLKLGGSPLTNFKEVLRKFPELLPVEDLDQVFAEDEEAFGRYFYSELSRYESQSHEGSMRPKGTHFELQGPKWIKTIYGRFATLLNQEYGATHDLKYKSLLHLLSLCFEEKLKTKLSVSEVPFYFFRLFSPLYRLQEFFLTTQLKRRLVLLGGDYKESSVQYWQTFEHKFENLLLQSFEGVISGERVLFFSHLPHEVPFHLKSPYALYRKTQMIPQKRVVSPFPPSALTLIADDELLGSEKPFRVLGEGSEFAFYHWPYPELPGSKPEFYDRELQNSFHTDGELIPFHGVEAQATHSGSMTLDLRPLKADRLGNQALLETLPIEITEEDSKIRGFEYWGPFRYRTLGLLALSYGIEGI